jgi:hypothetical protein
MFYLPQINYLNTTGNQPAIDFVGKTENMQADFDYICNKLGIPTSTLDHKNTSEHDDYRTYYDEDLKQKVKAFYQADLDAFDYSF